MIEEDKKIEEDINDNNYESSDSFYNNNDMVDIDSELKEEDLVFNQKSDEDGDEDGEREEEEEGKEKTGGGFSVKKAIMKAGLSPFQLVGGGAFGEPTTPNLSSYAIPNWAYSNGGYKKGSEINRNIQYEENDEYVSDDLHDRLLNLVRVVGPKKESKVEMKEDHEETEQTPKSRKTIKKTKKLRKSATSATKKGGRKTKKKRGVK